MKAKITIEIWDDTTLEQFEKNGSIEFYEDLFKFGFERIVEHDIIANGANYSVDVKITE